MNTTGLPSATIARLYEGGRLAEALREARARTLSIYAHLDLAGLEVPCIPIVNPPLWELAHIAWFQERWCLRYSARTGALARRSRLPGADALFDSGAVPHGTRWHLRYPPARVLFDYMRGTLEATLEALAATPEPERYFFALSLLHEDMHGEALLMTLQTLGLPAPAVAAAPPPPSAARAAEDVAFAGGEFRQGSAPGSARFIFDNEKWSHLRVVAPFRMASRPVSQGEFLGFIEDGGYEREPYWSREGWAWLERRESRLPLYWRRDGSDWHIRRNDGWHALDPAAPMVHVTLHEARAYCRWAGRRLPSETEWEYAARNGGAEDTYPWGEAIPANAAGLDYRHQGPSTALQDPAPARSGLAQMIGGTWEWTDTPFIPYPGFAADPYREYSQPWFESHWVLRGGSFATRSRLVHNRFRNFYLPERADVFSGFRTCAAEAP